MGLPPALRREVRRRSLVLFAAIARYVEHPIAQKPRKEKKPVGPIPLILTKEEEEDTEGDFVEREMIGLGLIPAPRVNGSAAGA